MQFIWWLLILPVVDLIVLVRMGSRFGTGRVLLWLLGAALLGILLVRVPDLFRRLFHSGRFFHRGPFARWRTRRPPSPYQDMISRGLDVAAALLLIFPGILTDILGLALLLPPVRRRVAEGLGRAFSRGAFSGGAFTGGGRAGVWRWWFHSTGRGRAGTGQDGGTGQEGMAPGAPEGGQPFPEAGRARDVEFKTVDRGVPGGGD